MLLISNVAGLLAIVVLFKLVREQFGDRLAIATTAFLSFFPGSIFLSAGYTEPLELLLVVSFFLALKRKHYLSAALLAGLAVADRSTGIVLLPVLVREMWLNRDQKPFFPALIPCDDWNWWQASWFTLLFIVLIAVGWSRLPFSWILFAMGALLLPYLTLSGGPAGFTSMGRFNLVSFPLFVVLADLGMRARWLCSG